jgi:hypothetical protein
LHRSGLAVTAIFAPISVGEALDRLTILWVKRDQISDSGKLQNIHREILQLETAIFRNLVRTDAVNDLVSRLSGINTQLWHIEDEIRRCEGRKDFGPTFIQLARSIYRTNDERAAIKRQINELTGSALIEEKSYTSY